MRSSPFDLLMDLTGRPADDPLVVAYHQEHGLPPPPVAFPSLNSQELVSVRGQGCRLSYDGELRREDCWPPRLRDGKLVPYLVAVDVFSESAAWPPGLPGDLDEEAVRALAISKREVGLQNVYCVAERDRSRCEVTITQGFGMGRSVRIAAIQMEAEDPRLAPFPLEARRELERQARVSAKDWDPTPLRDRCLRTLPVRSDPAQAEPLPPSLADLHASTDRDQVGELDLYIHPARKLGEITGWTGNPDNESEFFVFGYDGRGSNIAFWLVREAPLEQQPVVFLGSEGDGDIHPLSKDLPGFLELVAAGVEPGYRTEETPFPKAAEILDRHFPGRPLRTPKEIIEEAEEYHDIHHRMMVQLNPSR